MSDEEVKDELTKLLKRKEDLLEGKDGHPTEVYSRIVGYYRPVENWNNGKSQEFKDRKSYRLKDGK